MAQKTQTQVEQRLKFWQGHIDKWSKSRLSMAQYCRDNKLNSKSFTYYNAKIKKSMQIELVPVPMQQFSSSSFLKLNIGSQFQIEIPDEFSSHAFKQVLNILRSL